MNSQTRHEDPVRPFLTSFFLYVLAFWSGSYLALSVYNYLVLKSFGFI